MKNLNSTIIKSLNTVFFKYLLLTFFAAILTQIGFGQTTITSTPTGGPWNVGSTWVGGNVPSQGSNNNVVIAAGATVTMSANASAVNVTVNGNLTMNNTGIKLSIGNPGSNTGSLTLGSGSNLFIGSTNSVEFMATQAGTRITNNGGTIASTGLNGEDGGTILVNTNSGQDFGITGNVTLYNIKNGASGDGNYHIQSNTANGLRINGTLTASGNSSWGFSMNGNAPTWGPASTLYINRAGQGFNNPNQFGQAWSASSGTVGLTPGFPNNVTLVNMGRNSEPSDWSAANSRFGFNPSGIAIGLGGTLRLGDGTLTGAASFENVSSFSAGGIVVENNSLFVGPKAGVSFVNKGNITVNTTQVMGTDGNNRTGTGFFTYTNSVLDMAGPGGSIQTISSINPSFSITDLKVSTATNVKLNVPVNISGTLNLAAGTISTTSTNILTVNNTAVGAVTTSGGYVDGPLAWKVAATGNYTFPIGNGGKYLPLALSPNSTSGATVTATAFNQNSNGSPDKPGTTLSPTEYWSVSTSSTLTGPTVSVSRPADGIGSNNALASSSTSNGVYTVIGGTPNSGTNSINVGGIGSGSPVFITMVQAPLSVVKISGTNVGCAGTKGSLTLGGVAGTPGPGYTFSLDGSAFQASPTFGNLTAGNHIAKVKDNLGAIATDTLKVLGAVVINGDDKDVKICKGTSTTLVAKNLQNANPTYSWSLTKGGATIAGGNTASLTVSPTTTTKYYVTSIIYPTDKVVNGSFETGTNAGVTSSYAYNAGTYGTTPNPFNGYYKIGKIATDLCTCYNPAAPTPQDGTYMFIADGAAASSKVWEQDVTGLTPGSTYKFIFSYAAINNLALTTLRATVTIPTLPTNTTVQLGGDVQVTNTTAWTTATYNYTVPAGITSAKLTLTNMSAPNNENGNDFILDNFQFLEPCTVTDSINVIVSNATPGKLSAPQTICKGTNPNSLTLTGNTNTTITRWEYSPVANFSSGVVAIPNTAGVTTLTGPNTGASLLPVGTYYFRVVESGCGTTLYSDSTIITVKVPSKLTFPAVGPFCKGAPAVLPNPTNNPAITGVWSPLKIDTATVGTADYTFTPNAGQCAEDSTIKVTIKPVPTVTVPSDSTYCHGQKVFPVTFTSTPANATFGWTNNTTSIGLAASGNTSVPSFTATNTGNAQVTATITVTPTLTGCSGSAKTYKVYVNPTVTLALTSANLTDDQSVCINKAITNITYALGNGATGATVTGLPAGVSYAVAAGVVTISGTPSTDAGSPFTYTVKTTGGCGSVSKTGKITVLPVLKPTVSCGTTTLTTTPFTWNPPVAGVTSYDISIQINGGAIVTKPNQAGTTYTESGLTAGDKVKITVLPKGSNCYIVDTITCIAISCTPYTINVPSDITYCNGDKVPTGMLSSSVATATYAWTNDNINIGLAASDKDSVKSFTAVNTGNTILTSTISVTSKDGLCSGTPNSYKITVNPAATIVLNSAAGTDAQTKCVDQTITDIEYKIGGSATGVTLTGAIPAGVDTNYNPTTKIFTISGKPTSSAGSPYNYTVTTKGPCTPVPLTGSIVVKPIETPDVKCGTSTNTSVTFDWALISSANNYTLTYTKNGGAASSPTTNTTGTFTLGSLTPQDKIKITVTPNGPSPSCYAPDTLTCIAVPCSPINATVPDDIVVCAGTKIPTGMFSSTTPNIKYTWTNTNAAIGLAVSGADSVKAFTAVNPGASPLVATIKVTPTDGICPGTDSTYTITVNPVQKIVLTSLNNNNLQTLCINDPISDIKYLVSGGATSANFTVNKFPAGVTGSYNAGTKTFTITGTPSTAVGSPFNYTVTTSGTCAADSLKGTITIDSKKIPVVTCGPGASTYTTVDFQWSAAGAATTYSLSYSVNSVPVATPITVTGTKYQFTQLNPGDIIDLVVTPTGNGCFDKSVSVQCSALPCPKIKVTLPADITRCGDEINPKSSFQLSQPGTATYSWSIDKAIGLSPQLGTSDVPQFKTANGTSSLITATVLVKSMLDGVCPGPDTTYKISVRAASLNNLVSTEPNATSQIVCVNSPITPITYAIGGSALTGGLGSGVTLPAGLTSAYDPATNLFTISGTPTAATTGGLPYSVTTTGPCPATTRSGTIEVRDFFTLSLGADTVVCKDETVTLIPTASAAVSYLWTHNLSTASILTVAPIADSTEYIVTATNGACFNSDSIKVFVKNIIPAPVYIPNAFTPNGDTKNDLFQAYGEGVMEFDGKIFNRWGELIYTWDDMLGGWDGKDKTTGKPYMNEVFIYTIRVKHECEKTFGPVQDGLVKLIK